MRGIDVTVVAFARKSGGVSVGVVSGSAASLDQVDALVVTADAAARAADPAADANALVDGTADDAWSDAPGETDIHVFDAFAPALGEAFGRARSGGRILYGFVDHDVTTTYVGSSTGLRLRHEQPTGHYACTGKTADLSSSAWVGGATRDFVGVDALAVEATLEQRLGWARRTVDLPAGRYDTILPPTAVADLMIDAYWYAGARDAHDGQSVYSRRGGGTRIGDEMVRPEVTLFSDPAYPGLECAPQVVVTSSGDDDSVFDTGLPLSRTAWLDHGRLAALRQTRETAALTGQPVTPAIDNLVLEVEGATGSIDDLVAGSRAWAAADLPVVHPRGRPPDPVAHRADPRRRLPDRERRDHGRRQQLPLQREPDRPAPALHARLGHRPGVQSRMGRRLLLAYRHARAPRARLQHVERLAGALAVLTTDVEKGQSSAASANASGGGQEQTRCRSPYAWSMRATGGQYLSGSGPVGKTATSRG